MRASSSPTERDGMAGVPHSPIFIQEDGLWSQGEDRPSFHEHYPGFDIHPDPVDDIVGPLSKLLSAYSSSPDDEEANKENVAPSILGDAALAAMDAQNSWLKAGLPSIQQSYGCLDNTDCRPIPTTPFAQECLDPRVAHRHSTPSSSLWHTYAPHPSNLMIWSSPTRERTSLDKSAMLERKKLLADEADGMNWQEEGEEP